MTFRAITSALLASAVLLAACGGGASDVSVPEAPIAGFTDSPDEVHLIWNNVSGATSYDVSGRVNGGNWADLATTGAAPGLATPALVVLGRDVPVHARVELRVRARSGSSNSAWSTPVVIDRPRMIVALPQDRYGTGGTFRVSPVARVSVASPTPPDVDLYANDIRVGHIGPPPWPIIPVDTTSWPEGRYVLSVRTVATDPTPEAWTSTISLDVSRATSVSWDGSGIPRTDVWPDLGQQLLLTPSITYGYPDTPPPPRTIVRAGDRVIAELGPPPWSAFVWDLSAVPEGVYPIRVEIPGYSEAGAPAGSPTGWQGWNVHVDHTPPVVSCVSGTLGTAAGWRGGVIQLDASEYTFLQSATLLVGGSAYPLTLWPVDSGLRWTAEVPMDVPLGDAMVTATGQNEAGWPLQTNCAFAIPPWLSPWGDGPLQVGGADVQADAFAVEGRMIPNPSVVRALQGTLAWAPTPGASDDGRLLVSSSDGSGFGSGVAVGSAASVATSVALAFRMDAQGDGFRRVAWSEQPSTGPGKVWTARQVGSSWMRDAAPLGDPARTGRHVRLKEWYGNEPPALVGWSEEDGAGGSVIRVKQLAGSAWVDVPGVAPAVPGSTQESLSLELSDPGGWVFPFAHAAFLETAPGGVAQVRLADAHRGGALTAVAGVGNVSPAVAAGAPSVSRQAETVVAWEEDGRVYAYMTNDFGGPGIPVDPVALNTSPGRQARLPQVVWGWGTARAPLRVYFVEQGPTGDEIWARRWDGTSWELMPGPVNAGVPGSVVDLQVAPLEGTLTATVAWRDGTGRVYVRAENR